MITIKIVAINSRTKSIGSAISFSTIFEKSSFTPEQKCWQPKCNSSDVSILTTELLAFRGLLFHQVRQQTKYRQTFFGYFGGKYIVKHDFFILLLKGRDWKSLHVEFGNKK